MAFQMNHAAAAVDFLIQLYTTVFAKLPAFKVIFQSILHVSRPPSTKMGGDAAAWMGEMVENFPLEALSSANPVLGISCRDVHISTRRCLNNEGYLITATISFMMFSS